MKYIVSSLFEYWTTEDIRGLLVIITFFGILLGLLTFIVERIISRNNRKKENKKNWLIEIIISPEIDNINKYFLDAVESFDIHVDDIDSVSKGVKETPQKSINKRSINIKEFIETNKLFINTFVSLIQEYDKKVGNSLKELIGELKDTYTELLGDLEIDSETAKFNFNQKCNFIKAKFYYELFKIVV